MGPLRLTACAGLLVAAILVPTADAADRLPEAPAGPDPAPAAVKASAASAGPGTAHAVTGLALAGAAVAAVARRGRRTDD